MYPPFVILPVLYKTQENMVKHPTLIPNPTDSMANASHSWIPYKCLHPSSNDILFTCSFYDLDNTPTTSCIATILGNYEDIVKPPTLTPNPTSSMATSTTYSLHLNL
jgi:hypothetical protein